MTFFVGIDPGVSGALAAVDQDGQFLFAEEMPTFQDGKATAVDAVELGRLLFRTHDLQIPVVAVERVSAMPGQGVVSMFNFGKSYGTALGVVGALGFSRVDVTPQTWKKHHGLIGSEKDASRGLAIRMFPQASLSRKKDHGMADALLIARWLRDCHGRA
jgi:crossover junction endodeoxyribonuclease RuvC